MRRSVAIGTAAAMAFTAVAAHAFTRSRTPKDVPMFWPGTCVFVTPDDTPPVDLTLDAFLAVLTDSVGNWQKATTEVGCSYLRLNLDAPTPSETRPDGQNVVRFRDGDPLTTQFCRPANDKEPQFCYSPTATAITTVRYIAAAGKPNDGAIWDADIELNAINFTFIIAPSAAKARSGTSLADLENTLTHELGHLQGLDHTCWDRDPDPAPPDGNGNPIPGCGEVSPCALGADRCREIALASMYNYARPAEITKRTPKADDIAGICAVYPAAKDPMSCTRYEPSKSGCSVAGGVAAGTGAKARNRGPWGAGAAAAMGLVLLGGMALARRRRR